MKRIFSIFLMLAFFGATSVYGQGCASIIIKKSVTQPNGVDTLIDFTAAELNNGIQLQCGIDNYIAADIFFPGGGTDQYEVESIPYNPPLAYNSGNSYASQLCNNDDRWGTVFSLNYGFPPNPNVPNFTFDFYGVTYPMAVIGANGLISFDYTNPDCFTQNPASGCTYCAYTQEGNGAVPTGSRYKNCIMHRVILSL